MVKLGGPDWHLMASQVEEAANCLSNPIERERWMRVADEYRLKAEAACAAETGREGEVLKPRPRFLRNILLGYLRGHRVDPKGTPEGGEDRGGVMGISPEAPLKVPLEIPLWKLLVAPLILPIAAVFFWLLYSGISAGFGMVVAGIAHALG